MRVLLKSVGKRREVAKVKAIVVVKLKVENVSSPSPGKRVISQYLIRQTHIIYLINYLFHTRDVFIYDGWRDVCLQLLSGNR